MRDDGPDLRPRPTVPTPTARDLLLAAHTLTLGDTVTVTLLTTGASIVEGIVADATSAVLVLTHGAHGTIPPTAIRWDAIATLRVMPTATDHPAL